MEPWIPKFMIVSGAVTIFIVLLALCAFGAATREMGGCSITFLVLAVICGLFLFGWNIAGSVWVFSKWKDWDTYKAAGQCDNDMYLFAFALLIIFWITLPCQAAVSSKAKEGNN